MRIGQYTFLHSCKQRYQLEAWMDNKQWFVWNCPPAPQPHFFVFAHWRRTRKWSIWNLLNQIYATLQSAWKVTPTVWQLICLVNASIHLALQAKSYSLLYPKTMSIWQQHTLASKEPLRVKRRLLLGQKN